MNKKFVFVILHYQSTLDTIECIDSIFLSCVNEDFSIVVVDNNSPNDSGKDLKEKYLNQHNIIIIENMKNNGFAKGNNIGFNYAKHKLNPDFIIVINNDMILDQSNFLELVSRVYDNNSFDILGPKIISLKDNFNQNLPDITFEYTIDGINQEIVKRQRYIKEIKFGLHKPFNKIRFMLKKYTNNRIIKNDSLQNYTKLHGSCLIFSKGYIKRYNGFFSKTFMYIEEDILSYIAYKEDLAILYNEDIKIYHKEDGATDTVLEKPSSKLNFIYNNEIESLREFKKIIENSKYYENDIISKHQIHRGEKHY